VTAEDFEEGVARDAYILIETFGRNLLLVNSTPAKRNAAMRFFFIESEDSINFKDCCEAIDPMIRPGVILLRFQYEFWLRWFTLATPLPENAVDLPEEAKGRAAYIAGDPGVTIAREAWFQPGLSYNTLLERSCFLLPPSIRNKVPELIERLVDANVLSVAEPDHWYATGRNPALYAQETGTPSSTIIWSALF